MRSAALVTVLALPQAGMAQTIGSGSTVTVSGLGSSATPAFQGGTLQVDKAGTYANNFTLSSSTTSTIDAFGHTATFSGIFSDATAGTAGPLIIADTASGGIWIAL